MKKSKIKDFDKNKNKKKEIKNPILKFLNFVWNGESFLSWITFILLAFIIIKFVLFPLMSFATGTPLPLVIVESCSMYHGENFDNWWENNRAWYEENNISKEQFENFPLKNGFQKGDIFLVLGEEEPEVGEVIIFFSGKAQRPIIHRVIDLKPTETKGDNNDKQFTKSNNPEEIDETLIVNNQLLGRATGIRIPYAGWAKLIFFEPLRSESERGFCK